MIFFPRPKKIKYSQLHSNTLWSQSVKTTKVEHIELTNKKNHYRHFKYFSQYNLQREANR